MFLLLLTLYGFGVCKSYMFVLLHMLKTDVIFYTSSDILYVKYHNLIVTLEMLPLLILCNENDTFLDIFRIFKYKLIM